MCRCTDITMDWKTWVGIFNNLHDIQCLISKLTKGDLVISGSNIYWVYTKCLMQYTC